MPDSGDDSMTNEEVNKRVEDICSEIKARSVTKGQLYTTPDADRLGNFKRQALLSGCTPEQVIMVLMSKNLLLLSNFVHNLSLGQGITQAEWDDKIYDTILYLMLLKVLVVERHSGPNWGQNDLAKLPEGQ